MRRWWGATLLSLALVVGATGCSADNEGAGAIPQPPPPGSPSLEATPDSGPLEEPSSAPRAGELKSSGVKHTVRTGTLTVDILYTPAAPVAKWTADGPKP